ncbi:MAG TPA: response regulator [Chitinophagaceae bacterium]|jgi:CheY-like chemotaxis protein|nr:response regulator [Chitinophagaceae bacterium]
MTKFSNTKNVVLYADDDPDDLELVKDAFYNFTNNVEVLTFSDGIQALSYLNDLSDSDPTPCLIILDINMPMLSGKDVLIRVRENKRFEEVPVVLFTTSSLPNDKTFAAQYKSGFITKPIDANQMARIADQFIDHCGGDVRDKIRRQMQ